MGKWKSLGSYWEAALLDVTMCSGLVPGASFRIATIKQEAETLTVDNVFETITKLLSSLDAVLI